MGAFLNLRYVRVELNVKQSATNKYELYTVLFAAMIPYVMSIQKIGPEIAFMSVILRCRGISSANLLLHTSILSRCPVSLFSIIVRILEICAGLVLTLYF